MKKIMFAAMALTMGLAFTSCMGGEEMDVQKVEVAQLVDADFQLNLRVVTNSDSRSIFNGDAEDSGIHENFVEKEFAVKTVRLYFVNGEGEIAIEKDLTMTKSGEYAYTGSDKYTKFPAGTYDVYAITNCDNFPQVSTLAELLEAQGVAEAKMNAVPESGFIMTNRGNQPGKVTIVANQKANLNLEVERTVAKIRVKVAGSYNSTSKKYNDFYIAGEEENEVVATVTINDHQFVNLNKDFYLFRHVADIAEAADTPAKENVTITYGQIPASTGYAIDPHFFEKTVAAATAVPSYLAFPYTGDFVSDNDSIYCLPNTMFRPAQKHAYTTGLRLKATLRPSNITNDNGNAVSDASQVYFFNNGFYTSLNAAKKYGKLAQSCTEDKLNDYGVRRYERNGEPKTYTTNYIYWIRHHDTTKNPIYMDPMEFGIVRNNIYDLIVKSVKGAGVPTFDPEDPSNPEGPDTDDETYYELEVELNVKPWIVRTQEIEFE